MNLVATCISERVFDTEFLIQVVGSFDDNLSSFRFARNKRFDDLFNSPN